MARHPTRWLIPLLSILALPAWAGVEVFTTAGQPVVNVPSDAAVVEIDAPARLDAQLSEGIPANRDQARQEALRRLKAPDWQAKRQALKEAAMGTARAWMIGIKKVPAVVVDSRYVVYGEADVSQALEQIEAYQQETQQEASP
ncbi:TIGR03757 family integrating conjugative element protein [Halomonas elongata]|uniref:Secretion cluster MPF-G protein Tfc24 n=1 Tax=Halomonas elongata (strain ATCC 33173 / DSM 2581 / NBRC 15536 / NCIMB 2198 / 1H9) TaxID=768066 RepID=E1VA63_HALED|nr:TIGR03757 family integrating conjugative element protein [Halomonas elongata]WBF17693.1 TIGR03757 family integrating conjugative element protein [Halomonas elongata]WPU46534.1 TIGR03757 family integrating conjugative element protein [Halomonas elongata DSM 2581]CBV43951.1 secretion cluster MPF-G protein Tfc24 [Halomonas elongata DSM 2581]